VSSCAFRWIRFNPHARIRGCDFTAHSGVNPAGSLQVSNSTLRSHNYPLSMGGPKGEKKRHENTLNGPCLADTQRPLWFRASCDLPVAESGFPKPGTARYERTGTT